jgi:hypothetical protein
VLVMVLVMVVAVAVAVAAAAATTVVVVVVVVSGGGGGVELAWRRPESNAEEIERRRAREGKREGDKCSARCTPVPSCLRLRVYAASPHPSLNVCLYVCSYACSYVCLHVCSYPCLRIRNCTYGRARVFARARVQTCVRL